MFCTRYIYLRVCVYIEYFYLHICDACRENVLTHKEMNSSCLHM